MSAALERLLVALAVLLLAGCSVMQTAYNNADKYLRWRATSYFDVHGEQLEALERSIERLHRWHRAHALPQYAGLAEAASERLAKGLSREDVLWGYDAVIGQVRQSVRAAAENAAPLLEGLNGEQIEHLERRLAEDNRRFARQFLRGTPEERRKRRARRTVERLEEWVGPLTPAQAERVALYSERAPLTDELRDAERRRLQAELLAMVRERSVLEALPRRAAHWERGRDPAFEAAGALHRSEHVALLLDIDRMLTPEQRARAAGRLRDFAAEFRVLAARADNAGRGR